MPFSIAYKLMNMQDGEAYAHLLNALAPEFGRAATLETKDPTQRANLILEHVERMECKSYISPNDIVEGSQNLNLAFVAHIFQHRFLLCSPLWHCKFFFFFSFYVWFLPIVLKF